LKQRGKVFVLGLQDPSVARNLEFIPASSVSEALGPVEEIHGKNYNLAYIDQPALPKK